jgi:hypothetical protein
MYGYLALFFSTILALGLLAGACSGGGGGDDDDTADDDDDDDNGNAFDNCVSFYQECAGMDQNSAESACQWIDQYANGNDCVQAALADYFDCLDANIDCDNFDTNAAMQCATDFSTAVADCGGDDDDDDDIFDDDTTDDDDDTGECAGNVAPELLSATYVVNGGMMDPPINVDANDLFGIYFEYNDDDCNLPGGAFWLNVDGAGYEAFPDPLPEDLLCSTAESGLIYGFSMQNPMAGGAHNFATYWTDVCDEASNELTGNWTVN